MAVAAQQPELEALQAPRICRRRNGFTLIRKEINITYPPRLLTSAFTSTVQAWGLLSIPWPQVVMFRSIMTTTKIRQLGTSLLPHHLSLRGWLASFRSLTRLGNPEQPHMI